MKSIYLLLAILISFSTSLLSQTKKEQIEKLEKEIYELKENFIKVNTKSVILEEKLKFAEKEISSLNRQIAAIQLLLKPLENKNQNTDNSKSTPITENSGYYSSETQKEQAKPTQSPGQCQAITKKGTRCSRKAQQGRMYCYQH